MGSWLGSPAGAYALAWTQEQVDRAVVDAFGYHAVQLGLPELDGLRANRMPHRWIAQDALCEPAQVVIPTPQDSAVSTQSPVPRLALHCDFDALPFPSASIDLVLLPHTLEMSRDPHATLAEVERVLVAEGRVVIVGFNPLSLWGLRQWAGFSGRLGQLRDDSAHDAQAAHVAHAAEFLGYRRVRDWLRLLSFEIEGGRFGLWRPPVATQKTLDRLAWMDRLGSHWWPVLGGVYAVEAVKRVRGMRMVGLKRLPARRVATAPAVVAQRRRKQVEEQSL